MDPAPDRRRFEAGIGGYAPSHSVILDARGPGVFRRWSGRVIQFDLDADDALTECELAPLEFPATLGIIGFLEHSFDRLHGFFAPLP